MLRSTLDAAPRTFIPRRGRKVISARSYGKRSSKRSSFTDIRKHKEPMAGNFGKGKTRNTRLYWESPRLILQMLLSGLQLRQKQKKCRTTRSDDRRWTLFWLPKLGTLPVGEAARGGRQASFRSGCQLLPNNWRFNAVT